MRYLIIALAAAVLPVAAVAKPAAEAQTQPAVATQTAASTLLPGALDLPLVDGSSVPTDCRFPASLRTAGHYDLACVVIPASGGNDIGAQYLGMLGQRGWHQGELITGGFSAVHAEANGCQKVLGIYPSEYPSADGTQPQAQAAPRDQEEFGGDDDDDSDASGDTVIWFALDRQEHCNAAHSQ